MNVKMNENKISFTFSYILNKSRIWTVYRDLIISSISDEDTKLDIYWKNLSMNK